MDRLIGRHAEIQELDGYYNSGKAEFIALYGRRRVGKTFLIDEYFNKQYSFSAIGVIDGEREEQMSAFLQGLRNIGYKDRKPRTWMAAFYELSNLLESKIAPGQRCVIFIDELPCFDTAKSGFVRAFGHFWNSWAQKHEEILLVVCGSATTWMIDNIIDSHGGLHNRITHEMHLQPFSLSETEQMLRAIQISWDRLSILQMYMALGGIPYYLSLLKTGESAIQAIDRLFFEGNAPLRNEYERLFASLFRKPEPYLKILEELSAKRKGITREEIAKSLEKSENGHLSNYLKNLIKCDFVRYYYVRSTKIKKTDGLYQLTDFFVIFYNTFVKKTTTDEHYWTHHISTPTANTWHGLSFERICMAHIPQIKQALGIDRIGTEYYSWRSKNYTDNKNGENGAQIDLLIERADRIINLCEIKYSSGQYVLDKDEDLRIRNRQADFVAETKTRYAVMPVLISTFGLKANSYSGGIQLQITLDDLFQDKR